MKLNWREKLAVNNPIRILQQYLEMGWLKGMMPLAPGGEILEIGCGRGVGAKLIDRTFRPVALHIQDLDMIMIRKAKKRLAASKDKQISESLSLSVSDTNTLPFKTESFDAVFGFGVLHHVPDWQGALIEITRVLKPGGIYYVEELYPSLYQNLITKHILLHPKENRFRSSDLRKAFEDAAIPLKQAFELEKVGVLGVAVKMECPTQPPPA
jgi:ubiquinone/menaquinone biosynthesis C-methylase UbiE